MAGDGITADTRHTLKSAFDVWRQARRLSVHAPAIQRPHSSPPQASIHETAQHFVHPTVLPESTMTRQAQNEHTSVDTSAPIQTRTSYPRATSSELIADVQGALLLAGAVEQQGVSVWCPQHTSSATSAPCTPSPAHFPSILRYLAQTPDTFEACSSSAGGSRHRRYC